MESGNSHSFAYSHLPHRNQKQMKAYLPIGLALLALLALLIVLMMNKREKQRIDDAVNTSRETTRTEADNFDPAPLSKAFYQELVENWTCNPQLYRDTLALSDERIRKVWADYEAKYKRHKGSLKQAISQSSYFDWSWLLLNSCSQPAKDLVQRLERLNLA
jgi:hypothetical protein